MKKLAPFDLEKALEGAEVVTRDGRPVTNLTLFEVAEPGDYCLTGILDGKMDQWTRHGSYYRYSPALNTQQDYNADLFMPVQPLVAEGWVNVYADGKKVWFGAICTSEEDANTLRKECNASRVWVRTIHIKEEI